ncbi:MAG: stress response translation initiation inhibitor YciH [Thermoflexaceae bacterium]|nr:stress response translation initiation inhibitor YciH [Thermoflexaceae bacterium]
MNNSRLVYSTDGGRVREQSPSRPGARPPAPARPQPPADGVVRIMRDRRGRGGKTATVVVGLPGTEAELDSLLKALKQLCGAGGSRDGRMLEIQGDHRERLQQKLEAMGHRVRLAGG